LKALKKLAEGPTLHWSENKEILEAKSLEEALAVCQWEPINKDNGGGPIVDIMFVGEKIGSDFEIFKAIGPYVKAGSEIVMIGEDGHIWRWHFDGDKCVEEDAIIAWP